MRTLRLLTVLLGTCLITGCAAAPVPYKVVGYTSTASEDGQPFIKLEIEGEPVLMWELAEGVEVWNLQRPGGDSFELSWFTRIEQSESMFGRVGSLKLVRDEESALGSDWFLDQGDSVQEAAGGRIVLKVDGTYDGS